MHEFGQKQDSQRTRMTRLLCFRHCRVQKPNNFYLMFTTPYRNSTFEFFSQACRVSFIFFRTPSLNRPTSPVTFSSDNYDRNTENEESGRFIKSHEVLIDQSSKHLERAHSRHFVSLNAEIQTNGNFFIAKCEKLP